MSGPEGGMLATVVLVSAAVEFLDDLVESVESVELLAVLRGGQLEINAGIIQFGLLFF
jgi:hypothetical protein